MAIPGFFGKVVSTKVHGAFAAPTALKPKVVDVGDKKDCGFQAAAAAIISNGLTKPRTNHELLSLLLAHHTKYFTIGPVIGHSLTPAQRFEKMLAKPDIMAQFIRDLAYTLRQLAVEEMCTFPKKYHVAFIGKNAPTSVAEMRQADTWIHKVAIEALANVLKIPITVSEMDPGKGLKSQLHYGPEREHAGCDEIVMQRQERNHYLPQVIQVERFKALAALRTNPVQPLQNQQQWDGDLPGILESIKDEERLLVDIFDQNVRRLTTMVEAAEVNKKNLLAVYVKGIETKDSRDTVKKAGLQHGNQRFFDDVLYNTKRATNIVDITMNSNHDEQVIKELVHAFARDFTLGLRDENNVFAQFDSLENERKTSKTLSY